jgi:5-methyltetrahydrofolate--homocysteine methyltransferase
MKRDIILLDGAMGTGLWNRAEARGVAKVPVWIYNIEQPDMVIDLTREYIAAGSQVVQANTFGANRPSVARSSTYSVSEVVKSGVALAKEAVAGTDVRVALSVGPLSEMMEPFGDLTEEEVRDIYEEQIGAGAEAGADLITLETFMDVEMMRVAATVAKHYGIPVFCSMTFDQRGRTMMGNTVARVVEELEPLGIDAIGMNCSLGPVEAMGVIRSFADETKLPLIFKPNAGLPVLKDDGTTVSDYDAARFVAEVLPALADGRVKYVGGCCGTDPDYIRALGEALL